MRQSSVERKSLETGINIDLTIDGNGRSEISTGIGFFDHMLEAFAKHGAFDLDLKAKGDLHVDQHHLVEDTGIMLGKAFSKALGDKKGINRAGFFAFPMDEALAIVAVDISGRPFLQFDCEFKRQACGELDTDLLEDFFQGFAGALNCNVVIRVPCGRSDHHRLEAVFKAFARAMRMACSLDPAMIKDIPSTKGMIDSDSDC